MPRLGAVRAAARRRQIVDAALACFARRGFHKTTMQDVAKQSGLSLGAIYCHFAGKNDIILAVVAERHQREAALLRNAAGAEDFATSLDRLVADFVGALVTPEERAWRRLAVQIWAESLHDRQLLASVRGGVEKPRALLAALIRRAQARRELPAALEADAAAHALIAVFQGLVLQLAWLPELDVAGCAAALMLLLRRDAKPPQIKAAVRRGRRMEGKATLR